MTDVLTGRQVSGVDTAEISFSEVRSVAGGSRAAYTMTVHSTVVAGVIIAPFSPP